MWQDTGSTHKKKQWLCCLRFVYVTPSPAAIQSERNTERLILIINWLAYQDRLLINSYNLHQPIILVCVSHMAWYLLSVRHSHLASSVSGLQLQTESFLFLEIFCSCHPASTSCLVAPPIHPAQLLGNQHFIKAIQLINLYRAQDHCLTALLPCFKTGTVGQWSYTL